MNPELAQKIEASGFMLLFIQIIFSSAFDEQPLTKAIDLTFKNHKEIRKIAIKNAITDPNNAGFIFIFGEGSSIS